MILADLVTHWRTDAETLARYGDERLAAFLRATADQLEAALKAHEDELLDLSAAAKESGYSADRLRHKIADGELPNAGQRGAPRIRRADLPRKSTRRAGGFDADAIARRFQA
ncbi:MAG TPA: hypothetical protein VGM82_18915 [Gemmatimonadaceae bacterium]